MGTKTTKGFIRVTLIIVGALVILKYAYGVDIVGFLTSGKFKEWLDKFYAWGSIGWEKYNELIVKIWNYILALTKLLIAKIKN